MFGVFAKTASVTRNRMKREPQIRKTNNSGKEKKQPRFPGVSDDAKRLGCSKQHLWLTLAGQRTSHRLMQRYLNLKGKRTRKP